MYIAIYTNQINNGAKHNSVLNIMLKISHTSMTILGFDVETIFKQEAHAPHRSPEQITLFNFQRTSEKAGIQTGPRMIQNLFYTFCLSDLKVAEMTFGQS